MCNEKTRDMIPFMFKKTAWREREGTRREREGPGRERGHIRRERESPRREREGPREGKGSPWRERGHTRRLLQQPGDRAWRPHAGWEKRGWTEAATGIHWWKQVSKEQGALGQLRFALNNSVSLLVRRHPDTGGAAGRGGATSLVHSRDKGASEQRIPVKPRCGARRLCAHGTVKAAGLAERTEESQEVPGDSFLGIWAMS